MTMLDVLARSLGAVRCGMSLAWRVLQSVAAALDIFIGYLVHVWLFSAPEERPGGLTSYTNEDSEPFSYEHELQL